MQWIIRLTSCSHTELPNYSTIENMLKFVVLAALVAIAAGQGYGHQRRSYQPVRVVRVARQQNAYADDLAQPTPYKFSYDINDEYNNQMMRQESGDGYGNVQGTYGYMDAYGIFRRVEYTADGYGFRANVKTNEPGTANQNPADVNVHSEAVEVKHQPQRTYAPVRHQTVSYAPVQRVVSYAPVQRVVAHAPVARGYQQRRQY